MVPAAPVQAPGLGADANGPAGPLPADDTTSDLLDRARAGDGCALELLCQRCLPRLEVWATGRLPRAVRGAVDTGDIVQETLLRVIRHVAVFLPRHEEAFQAYLRKTLFNLIKDAGRRARVLQALTSLVEEQVDPRPSPLDEAIGQDLAARYRAALERLPPDDQQVIILRVERGMSYAEVAAVTGKPSADAARMAVARARSRLAEELRDEVDASLAARAHGDGAARSGGNGHVRPPRRVRCIE